MQKIEKQERYFQGVFTDGWLFEMVECGRISITEAWLWLNVRSFQKNGRKCWMSNDALGQRAKIKARQTQICITNLIEVGLLNRTEEKASPGGVKQRILACCTPAKYLDEQEGGAHLNARRGAIECAPRGAIECALKNTNIERIQIEKNTLRTPGKPVRGKSTSNPAERLEEKNVHQAFIDTFVEMWQTKYRGKKYPFNKGKDPSCIKYIREYFENDLGKFKKLVSRFLSDSEKFNGGHDIGKLRYRLTDYVVDREEEFRGPEVQVVRLDDVLSDDEVFDND